MEDTKHQIGEGLASWPSISVEPGLDDRPAWVMIENGRYQPQRIKGSCLGRELG